PSPPATAAEFDPVDFRIGKDTKDFEVAVRMKRVGRPVRMELTSGPLGDPTSAMLNVKGADGSKLVFYNRLGGTPPWLPVGVPLEIEVSAFGCLKRIVSVTVPPGEGEHVIRIALDDE